MASYYYSRLLHPMLELPETFPEHVENACLAIRDACEGLGTNEEAVIAAITSVHEMDRELIVHRYKQIYGEELTEVLKSETSGDFRFLLRLLSMPLHHMEAWVLREATKGLGTTERLLYPIVVGRTPAEMNLLKRTYYDLFNEDLGVLMDSELSGDFRKVITAAVQAQVVPFKDDYHTSEKAEEDADKIYKAGEGKWGTDEATFIQVLFSSPPQYVNMINQWYLKKYNNSLRVAVEKEFGGDAKKALLFYVGLALDPYKTFADHFESTMKGIGTDEKGLSVTLVRFRPWLRDVAKQYEREYSQSLRDRIKGETNGDYRKLLLALYDAPFVAP
ncbi:hypothetical protein Poli38472_010283 [Pythium oligandrum]|uniref:Annexin n=1 Tax=Pythium oligandrum TaxID=41045 RepID=A0A8K1FF80_PYTOL|nr:hypothetical protein Poli38472_010283 [Pythium oligandrum]|eukprot:TMW58724.1 hypothetical protein Poli38472_010283 [Pythium oligandrum]